MNVKDFKWTREPKDYTVTNIRSYEKHTTNSSLSGKTAQIMDLQFFPISFRIT